MTLPKYEDFRQRNFEVWTVSIADRSLSVDVPRRRFDLSSIILSPEFISRYSVPNALLLYNTPNSIEARGVVMDRFTAIEFGPDLAKVTSGGKIGWVRLPDLSHHPSEAVDMAAAVIRLYRGDWAGAIDRLDRVLRNPGTRTRLLIDALLLRALVPERLGQSGRSELERAHALNLYSRTVIEYLVMSDLAQAARDHTDRSNLRTRIMGIIEANRYMFAANDKWLLRLQDILATP